MKTKSDEFISRLLLLEINKRKLDKVKSTRYPTQLSDRNRILQEGLPDGLKDKKIKNPKTGRMIKLSTALSNKKHPAYKEAMAMLKKGDSKTDNKTDSKTDSKSDSKSLNNIMKQIGLSKKEMRSIIKVYN